MARKVLGLAPTGAEFIASSTMMRRIRKELYETFGGMVAKKFYEHKEIIK